MIRHQLKEVAAGILVGIVAAGVMFVLVVVCSSIGKGDEPTFVVVNKTKDAGSFVVVNKTVKPQQSGCDCVSALGGVGTCGSFNCPANGGKGCDACDVAGLDINGPTPAGYEKVSINGGPWHLRKIATTTATTSAGTRSPVGHTHTCANGHTWDHNANPTHTCQFCGQSQYVQDRSPRPVTLAAGTTQQVAPLTYSLPGAVSSGGCANGSCGTTTTTRRGLFR